MFAMANNQKPSRKSVLFFHFRLISFTQYTDEDLWLRCKKSLDHRFGRTNFSSYDFGLNLAFIGKEIYTNLLMI